MLTDEKIKSQTPSWESIKVPSMVCLITANGGGTKLLQSYFDDHPQIYNIPAYPMLYFYPHWNDWKNELADRWNWGAIIEKFCEKHASVIDSRRIPGFNGLNQLGDNKDEHVEIDEAQFRTNLKNLLKDQPISRRNFLLAVHYAFSLGNGEDIAKKKVLLWHHHVYEHLDDFMSDFPDAIMLGMLRDPRPKLDRQYEVLLKVDQGKLSAADCMIYREYVFNNTNRHLFDRIQTLPSHLSLERIYFIRHEDLKLKLEEVMRSLAKIMNIDFYPSMLQTTFNGKLWWGHDIYNMGKVTGTFEGVISKKWLNVYSKRELFVLDGIFLDFYQKFSYDTVSYKNDSWWNRFLLCLLIPMPFHMEWDNFKFYFNPKNHWRLLKIAYQESINKDLRPYYAWNATHLYKWTYVDFKLPKPRWYQRFVDYSEKVNNSILLFLSRTCYIAALYCRFLLSTLRMPIVVGRRAAMYYRVFFRRIFNQRTFAQLVG